MPRAPCWRPPTTRTIHRQNRKSVVFCAGQAQQRPIREWILHSACPFGRISDSAIIDSGCEIAVALRIPQRAAIVLVASLSGKIPSVNWTSDTVVSKIYDAADATGRVDRQRLTQWIDMLRQRPGDEVFEALIGVFCNVDREATLDHVDKRYVDQEYAGRILLAVKPPCSRDIQDVIKRTLATWDLSVEQLPWYFEAVAGREAVLQALDTLSTQVCSDHEQRGIDTFRFWLRARKG